MSQKRTTEDLIKIALDHQRNALLLLELRLTIGTLATASAGLVASIFGMNLLSGLETVPGVFYWISFGSLICLSIILRRYSRKMNMVIRYTESG